MILHGKGEWITAEADLLDDVIGRAPRFYLQPFAQSIDRLVMGTVHPFEAMLCRRVATQRLDIVLLLFGKFVPGNVQLERAAERDVEKLEAFADRNARPTARRHIVQ